MRLRLFGGPRLRRDGTAVNLSPYQAALLSIAFAGEHERKRRAATQWRLWGTDNDSAVRHRLSQLVYQTNQRCGQKVVELEGEFVRVHREAVSCDMDDLAELRRTERFQEACRLLSLGFASAVGKIGTEEFSAWVEQQQVALRAQLRKEALASLKEAEMAHEWTAAQEIAKGLRLLDPQEEGVVRHLMRAQAMAGSVREAEAVYRAFAESVDPSGQWVPEQETRILLRSVRSAAEQSIRTPSTNRDADKALPPDGRARELAQLNHGIRGQHGNTGWNTVTVSGEAGLGKTTLVEEAIQGARFRGFQVIQASAAELERKVPFSMLLEGLNRPWLVQILRTFEKDRRPDLGSLLPQLESRESTELRLGGPAHCQEPPRYVCEAFLQLFARVAAKQKIILFLDDFQWADPATAAILQFLHRRWSEGFLTLLLAYRPEELRVGDAVTRLIQELEAERAATAIRLQGLNDQSLKRIARSRYQIRLSDAVLDRITILANGNPLFLRELLSCPTEGQSSPSGESISIPPLLQQLINRRVEALDATARKVISILVVLEDAVSMEQLIRITNRGSDECVSAVEQLERLRLIAWKAGSVRARNDIVRHALYAGMSPVRRAVLHGSTAELLRHCSKDPPLERIALHYSRAGNPDLAHDYALEAVNAADSQGPDQRRRLLNIAYEVSEGPQRSLVAVRLARLKHESRELRAALELGEVAMDNADTLSCSDSLEVRLTVADSRHLLGLDEATTTLADLAGLERDAREAGQIAIQAAVLDTTSGVLERSGRHDMMPDLLSRLGALERVADELGHCRLLCARSTATGHDNPRAATAYARRGVQAAKRAGLGSAILLALQRYTAFLSLTGRLATKEGRAAVAEVGAASPASSDIASHVRILFDLARWHTSTGEYSIAAGYLDEGRALTARMDCPEVQCLEHLVRGNLALAQGDRTGALEALDGARKQGAVSAEDAVGSPEFSRDEGWEEAAGGRNLEESLVGFQGNLLLESGMLNRASRVAEQHPIAGSVAHKSVGFILFHARLRLRKGDGAGAATLLESGLDAKDRREPVSWLRLALEAVRLARRNDQPRPELAARARVRSEKLGLPGLAHDFVPFTD